MTTLAAARPLNPRAVPARTGVTFPRVLVSEWIKFRTVRSTVWTLGSTVVLMIGISVLAGWGTTLAQSQGGGDDFGGLTVATLATAGTVLAQFTAAVLGVLAITGEYSTGMIRSTIAAVPRRLPSLWAKALVVAVSVALVTLVAVALAYVATLPFHDDLGLSLDLGDSSMVRILLGTPLYLATVALLGLAIGALLRHSAGAISTVLGLLLVIPIVFALIPLTFLEKVSVFLPSNAGGRLLQDDATLAMSDAISSGAHLTPWEGYGVMAAWVVVLLAVAALLLRRRDA